MPKDLYLPVNIAGLTFKNPFYVASGPTTKSVKQLKRIEETGWAAASIKLTIDPAPYINRVPRYAIFQDRNALCFTAEKRLKFSEGLKLVEDAKKELRELLLMANITYAGDAGTEGWVNMAKKFEEAGADIIELNMCCPNMSYNVEVSGSGSGCSVRTGASLGQQGDAVAEIVREIKKAVRIPLFVKLTPEGGRIAQVAKAVYAAGADAVGGTANRLGIPPIDLENPGRAVYHLQDEISMSCHSGAWLKPLALRDTYEMRRANGPDVKILAAGGIRTARDAAEIIFCGADLIGICSETLISGYGFVEGVIADLKDYMQGHGYGTLRDMRDAVVPLVKSAPELTLHAGHAEIKKPGLMAPCKAACPLHVPAQAYVRAVAKGDFRRAYELISAAGPLQSVCAWVCAHPCEEACTRGEIGTPVPIRAIKRFVLERAAKEGWLPTAASGAKRTERIAVIGSGPAGLSAAWHLARAGYPVTVFERESEPGGMLRYAIPSFRMDRSVLDSEAESVRALGVRFEYGKELGRDFTVESLKRDGYAAVFVGVGAQQSRGAGIPGEDAEGVTHALDFLKAASEGQAQAPGRRVAVVGGGFTAVDAARTARRLGAEEVYLVYRRTREEMTASAEEIAEAEAEGVRVLILAAPSAVVTEDGRVAGLKIASQFLGGTDASGRRKPERIESAEYALPCDSVILAIGQKPEGEALQGLALDRSGMLLSEAETGLTSLENVYCGGDVIRTDSVIAAVAAGKRAAAAIDSALAGDQATLVWDQEAQAVEKEDVLKRSGYFKDGPAINLLTADGHARVGDSLPHVRVLNEEEAVSEANRCLSCGCGEGCAICADICSEFAVRRKADDRWEIDAGGCVACGMCYNRCPNANITMVDEGMLV